MEFGLALLITGEAAVIFALLYGFSKEEKLVKAENKILSAVKKKIQRNRRKKERKRILKINRRALYKPMKINDRQHSQKAA